MKFLILAVSLFISGITKATNYYFSSSSGDDSRTSAQAQNPTTPWKTINKLNSIFNTINAGDSILFQRGDIFYGSITINKSGSSTARIVLGAFGTGSKPIMSGFITNTDWTNTGANIWESNNTVSTLSSCNMVLINDINTTMGRTPNTGYWITTGSSSTSITDNIPGHLNTVDWTGAQVASRTARWHLDKATITSVSGNTISFSGMSYPPGTGWGYFILNDVRTLDSQNEWYYDPSSNKIKIYSTGDPGTVKIASLNAGINLNGKDYITFNNLDIQGYNTNGIDMPSRTGITVQDCNISYIGQKGIYCYPNSPNLKVTNCSISEINSTGIDGASSINAYIANNSLFNIGNLAGMGESGDLSYTGIISHGDNGQVLYNNVQNCGYIGIRWDGNSTLVHGNFINNTNYIKDDGGGIYTYPWPYGPSSTTVYPQRTVSNNIVLNTKGAIEGGSPSSNFNEAMGIYNDGTAPNTNYLNNTIANAYFGIFSNAGHDNKIDGNTIYNCMRGVQYNNYGGYGIANLAVTNNILVAATAGGSSCGTGQYAAFYDPGAGSMPTSFTASNNVYARPLDEVNGWIWRNFQGSACNTLGQWKSLTGQDAGSTDSPISTTNPNDLRFEYNETSVSKTISLGGDYIDMRGVPYSGTITLAPNTSTVLIKTSAANISPTANAGSDQTISLPTVITTLSGSGTDPDGIIQSYSWRTVSGPTGGLISNLTSAVTTVTSLLQGVYQFELKVTDNNGATDLDTVQVTVNLLGNTSPTANAGADQAITLPTNHATMNGSGTDPDGTITTYLWSQLSGPSNAEITNSASASTTVTSLIQGVYQFQLKVTDNNGATGTDVIQVTVSSIVTNTPYGGTAHTIPGTIELEDFDNGGQNIAYYDNTNDNLGSYYRPAESVDIEAAIEGTANIGWTEADEWMKYTVNVISAGTYSLLARVSSQNTSTSFRVEMDGVTIATVAVPNTGGYQNWQTVTIPGIPLTTGIKVMRVYFITGGYNLNDIAFTLSSLANQPPTVNAGIDQVITLPVNTVSLTGTGTDPDGSISAYLWTKISGPASGTITNSTTASTTVTGLIQGIYKFELKVTDIGAATATDTIQVTVNPAANQLPTANAGTDKTITLPTNTVSLTGTGIDPDGTINAYLWTKISGPANGTITSPASASTSITGLVQGIYKYELKVTDNSGATDTDTMQVTVNPAANQLPTANAGTDKTITLPTNTVSLTGTGTDPDGTINAYLWTKISGPANGTITNPTTASTTVTGLVQGIYKFELKVTDNSGATDTDTMQLTVNPAPNQLPTANAGADKSITLPTNTVSLTGAGTDPDGTINAYLWTKISGPTNGTIANASAASTTVTGLVQGIYKFELKVTDNSGAADTDTMQVTVNSAVNQLPVANAGLDQNIQLPTNIVLLNGTGTDPDGTITTYLWKKVSGPANGTITNINSASTSVTGLVLGIYKFELKVTDNSGATDTDTMQVIVNPAANIAPTANAGIDLIITLPTNSVSLNGSGIDPDGIISVYHWTKISGPTGGTITLPSSATTSATGLIQGIYKFELKVTDNNGATDTDTMQVTVNPAPNQLPTGNAGPDKVITLPTNTVSLTGSGTDPDGTISAYLWTKISGPAGGSITNSTAASTTVTGLVQGIYKFELKVTDNNGAADSDTMQVTVNAAVPPPAPNQLPIANAGIDQNITLPVNTISLTGIGTDPDGTITAYLWRKVSGPANGTITNSTTASTTVTGLEEGTYNFELKVTDNSGATDTDTMQLIVNAAIPPPAPNQRPSVNAGNDINIYVPDNTATLSGTATDADGYIAGYHWSIISGTGYLLSNQDQATAQLTGLLQGIYIAELTVTDNDGAIAKDTVQVTVGAARLRVEEDAVVILDNPVGNTLHAEIRSVSNNRLLKIELFDISGNLLVQKDLRLSQNVQVENIDMSKYNRGTYTLVVYFDKKTRKTVRALKL